MVKVENNEGYVFRFVDIYAINQGTNYWHFVFLVWNHSIDEETTIVWLLSNETFEISSTQLRMSTPRFFLMVHCVFYSQS